MRFLILFVFLGALFYVVRQWLINRQTELEQKTSGSTTIQQQLHRCERELSQVQKEKREIENSIQSLENQLRSASSPTPSIRVESERLIKGYQEELALRYTKVEFYEACITKLKSLLHNLKLSQEIASKQQRLKQLREQNQDDLFNLEELKHALDYEQTYLQTIDELSLKMLDSHSLQDAQAIRLELQAMTEDLRNGA